MKDNYFSKTKGQSAIEYLMTYGWMLLVVAIVGGAIFATVQGQCTQSTSGFTGADVQVENFGIDSGGELQMEVRNGASDEVTISNLTIDGDNVEFVDSEGTANQVEIGVGGEGTLETDETETTFEASEGCNEVEIEFTYEVGDLSDQVSGGTLTDDIEFVL